jgi:cleavage and polyadenylation specificity factor subunit 4
MEEKKPDNQKDCPYYLKGFCKRFAGGAKDKICPYQHTKKLICKNWMAGFCRNGPTCTRQHPK